MLYCLTAEIDIIQQLCSHKKFMASLERKLTLFSAWSLAFGGVIGWGSFVMPGTTFLRKAGTLGSLIAMELGAFIMLIISYGYAYMVKKFPISGGEFVYAERAFGRKHGFICACFLGLCYINIIPMNATALCLVFREIYGKLLQFGFHYSVAGYDIYFGEILLSVVALIIFARVASYKIYVAGIIQSFMAVVLICGVFAILAGVVIDKRSTASNFQPMFYTDGRSALSQIISILAVAPWAFVGFDTVPQLVEESNFSNDKIKIIMDTCIILGCFIYIALNLIAVSVIPEGYGSWVSYLNDSSNSTSFNSILTFSAANRIFGRVGLLIIGSSAICAMTTGMLCFYVATSRLLYSMARDKMLPSWFGVLNKYGAPVNAVKFCLYISVFAPFIGRNALSWTVDMSSIGGAIGYAYTSLAAYKYSSSENRKDIMIFGMLSFIFSVIFALLLLIPVPNLDCSLSKESYVLLILWLLMYVVFFFVNGKDINNNEYSGKI